MFNYLLIDQLEPPQMYNILDYLCKKYENKK